MNYNQIDLMYSININIKYALAMYEFYIPSFSMLRYNLPCTRYKFVQFFHGI